MRSASTAPILTRGDLAANITSYARHLRAANLTPATQRTYLASLDRLARFLEERGMPTDVAAMRREHLEAFIEDQLARWKPATAANRYSGIRPFFTWLVEEGELRESPMIHMRKPRLPEQAPPIPSDIAVERLLATCEGPGLAARRDAAILRTFLATGARLSEVAGLRWTPDPATNDVDLDAGVIRIVRGKGQRERISYLSAKAVKAIDRYLRVRRTHAHAALPWLWLGEKGRLTASGIVQMLKRRSRDAGVTGVHPHSFRHWYANEALSSGLQEGEIMALAGWTSREMLSRYAKAAERERAVAAARRVNVGDRL
ncbi:MAG: tyrosine-type recombinase/integrase [Chloroflexota bacterium]